MKTIKIGESQQVNESYKEELTKLVAAFNECFKAMGGTSVDSKDEIWLDLGLEIDVLKTTEVRKNVLGIIQNQES